MQIVNATLCNVCVVHNAVNQILDTEIKNVMRAYVVREKVYLMSDMNN